MRGVEQLAEARRGRRAASAATAASTRSFSVITWRTRRSSGAGRPTAVVGVAQRLEAEQLQQLAGTPRGARCSPTRPGSATRPSRAWRARGRRRSSSTERASSVAHVEPQGAALLAEQRRELVEQAGLLARPLVLDPRAQPREPQRRAAARRPPTAQRARRAPRRAPPTRRGRRPAAGRWSAPSLQPGSSSPARRSSATASSEEAVVRRRAAAPRPRRRPASRPSP